MSPRYVYPLDPSCPEARKYEKTLFDDPMTEAMGAPVDDIMASFRRRHRAKCKRCREYGLANAEIG